MARPPAEREAWIGRARAPKAARARALELLRAGAGATAFLPTGGAPQRAGDGPLPQRIGAYRITGLIGQGGMGAVYRGERASGDFDHVVAIKVIRPGALSDALVERFRRERQTLARLAHPNIARLFDGGETEAGEPYIVMEFVDGRPLGEWLALEAPSRHTRLELFQSVASAVAFAHQNLVVHGDVTPSNVLVDEAGRPKLIDFGIARAATEDASLATSQTRARVRSLTPGFAAPERLAGAPATTLSDVYSLGRLLERLLAGLPRDRELAAVIARATADEPEDRYSTVEALRDDIAAWRDGQPVAAARGGAGYVFLKFVRRRRLMVSAAATATSLLVAALAVTLVANSRAEAARAQAEARFEDVRTLAKVMMFDVYDEVAKVQGSVGARLLLAQTAQKYLDSLAADPNAPFDVRLEAGEGYFRLGRVVGFTGGGSLGRREEGKVLFGKSQAILEDLLAERPDRTDVRLALGHELAVLAGESLYGEGDSETGRRRALRARQLLSSLPQQTERSAGALAQAYLYEGDSYAWDNDIPRAGRTYEAGIRMVEALPPALRDSDQVRGNMSGLLGQAGGAYRFTGQFERAFPRMEQAVALARVMVGRANGSPETVRKLIASLWALGDTQRVAGRSDAALTTITEAVAMSRDMAARSPNDAGAKESIALTGIVLAKVRSARGEHRAAVEAADEVVAIRRGLVAVSGGNKGSRGGLAVSLKDAADVYRRAGQTERACSALGESRAILTSYSELSATDRENNLKPVEAALESCRA